MAEIRARIILEDSMSVELQRINGNLTEFDRQVQAARNSIRALSEARINIDTTRSQGQITELQASMNKLKKNIAIVVAAKDMATESMERIKSKAETLIKSNYQLEITALDKTKSVITGIRDSIFNLKTLAAGIVLGATGKEAFDLTLGNAISNEKYLSTLQTVLHSDKKGSEALKWSYNQAAATPFDAKEVVSGVTQLATSGLDYTKYLMPLGDTAAAMNKPLEQAMAAMAKLKSGQNGIAVDMFRDLGISNTDWKKAGATFSKQGELMQTDPQKNVDMVTKIMQEKYGGLMTRQSSTAGGMISNIGDTINGMGRGLAGIDANGAIMKGGLFDNFKQQLQVIMPLLNKVQDSKAFSQLQKDIGQLATEGGQKLTTFLKSFDNPKTLKEYESNFKTFISDVKAGFQIAKEFGSALLAVGKVLEPIIKLVAAHPKLFVNLFLGIEGIKGISTIVGIFKNIVPELSTILTATKVFGLGFTGVFKAIPAVLTTFSGTFNLWVGVIGSVLKVKLLGLMRTVATGMMSIFGTVTAFFEANPIVLAISLIVLAIVGLYAAWKTNFGGCRTYINEVIKDVEDAWNGLIDFFKHPIQGTINIIKSYKDNAGTVSAPTSIPGLSIPIPIPKKKNALGTSYFEGGETWVGENGPEVLKLPGGSKILSNRQSMNMMNNSNQMPNMNLSNSSSSMSSMSSQSTKWGQDIPEGMAKGIKDNTKSVTDATTFMAAKIKELIHFTAPDKGPLTLAA